MCHASAHNQYTGIISNRHFSLQAIEEEFVVRPEQRPQARFQIWLLTEQIARIATSIAEQVLYGAVRNYIDDERYRPAPLVRLRAFGDANTIVACLRQFAIKHHAARSAVLLT